MSTDEDVAFICR